MPKSRLSTILLSHHWLTLLVITLGTAQAEALSGSIRSAVLSPDSKHLAFIDGTYEQPSLQLVDVEAPGSKPSALFYGQRVTEGYWIYNKAPQEVIWATKDLLVVDYGYTVESINLNGKKVATLGERLLRKVEPGNPASTQVLVLTDKDDNDLAMVDARTGDRHKFHLPMSGKPAHWAFDKHGELRAVSITNSAFWDDKTTITQWYKPRGEADWQKLETFKITDEYWIPAYVPEQDNQLIVYANTGRDTMAVFRYNTRQH